VRIVFGHLELMGKLIDLRYIQRYGILLPSWPKYVVASRLRVELL